MNPLNLKQAPDSSNIGARKPSRLGSYISLHLNFMFLNNPESVSLELRNWIAAGLYKDEMIFAMRHDLQIRLEEIK